MSAQPGSLCRTRCQIVAGGGRVVATVVVRLERKHGMVNTQGGCNKCRGRAAELEKDMEERCSKGPTLDVYLSVSCWAWGIREEGIGDLGGSGLPSNYERDKTLARRVDYQRPDPGNLKLDRCLNG